ncbi:MAG TPA: VOC family protein [Acidimicrobiales bacterium]|nr:VOC family protein [Acidimicrobiales bacterium]
MTTAPSLSSEVEVAVDPRTAFTVFTEELDLWWARGPINYHDASRIVAKRCEPGVGGRLLEVYADGELELGRITVWQPGERLAWDSSLDDVTMEVAFVPSAGGTRVVVTARWPEGGTDRGGSSWVRVTPGWFGEWCALRGSVPAEPRQLDRLAVAVHYAKPATAGRWLRDAFGFAPAGPIPEDDGGLVWIEFRVGNCAVIVLKLDDDLPDRVVPTHVPMIFVDDLDAHHARAEAAGAAIVEPIHQHGYRAYTAADPEGHRWTFAQAWPGMRG